LRLHRSQSPLTVNVFFFISALALNVQPFILLLLTLACGSIATATMSRKTQAGSA
jgi:hypothetical protein